MTGIEIALALIKHFESCRLHGYVFPGENAGTIGWGHFLPLNETGMTITQLEADELLNHDLSERDKDLREQLFAEYSLLRSWHLGATLSFKYNCKPLLFDNSTFLSLLRQGNLTKAQAEFKRWIYGDGHIPLPGLVRRRRCEAFIFGGGSIAELVELNWFLQGGKSS